jgi:membrane-associated phospholipid phosphatase
MSFDQEIHGATERAERNAVSLWASTDSALLRAGSRLVWALIAAMGIGVVVSYLAAGLTVDYRSVPSLVLVAAMCAVVAVFYRTVRPDPAIFYAAESITQIFLISVVGALLAYGAATLCMPYRDAELLAVDHWLGFEPRQYLDFVYARPWLMALLPAVYLSMVYQPVVVFIVLTLTRRVERLHAFALALVISLLITIAIFALFPALGWYDYLGVNAAAYPRLQLFWNFASHLEAVRNGALRAVPLGDLRGIISFPSYHTAAAVLAVWAVWPVRFIRWPMLLLNLMMAASAPIEGAHYLIDVLSGGLVGLGAITAATAIHNRLRRGWAGAAKLRSDAAPQAALLKSGATL